MKGGVSASPREHQGCVRAMGSAIERPSLLAATCTGLTRGWSLDTFLFPSAFPGTDVPRGPSLASFLKVSFYLLACHPCSPVPSAAVFWGHCSLFNSWIP